MKNSICRVIPILFIVTSLLASCNSPGFGQKPPCGESVLKIGETSYRIKDVETKSDGSLKIPSNTPDVAYWLDQTDINYVFALSPTTENLALQNTSPEGATLTWENCNSSSYTLSAPQAGVPEMNMLLDQSFSGITIIVQNGNDGFVMRGEIASQEIQVFDTPDPSAIQAEVSLLETIPSEDKTTLTTNVSIANYGTMNITLTSDDVSLLVGDTTFAPLTSDPALPKEIAPGETGNFSFTFTYPDAPSATLKVFSAEYELEY